ncbi:ComF family protein [Tepidiphilus margaritifer]|uniref:ComF family protein n=1 Tax=Tepidiphilus margaritifer TaxID=203471 RepID=UPI0006843FFA|nr:ComF family protein [Tepidiphilus margaritifer]
MNLPDFTLLVDFFLPSHCGVCGLGTTVRGVCASCQAEFTPWTQEAACGRCGDRLTEDEREEGICAECTLDPPFFDAVRAGFWYEPPLDALIQRFKYGGDLRLGRALARALAQELSSPPAVDVLVPVPLARQRLRSRGFNQAAVLARDLGAAWHVPVLLETVQRRRETPHQARLHAAARRENLRGAFAVDRAQGIAGRRVSVVDDVLTTGATLNALAAVLLECGAAAVRGIVLARALSPSRRSR